MIELVELMFYVSFTESVSKVWPTFRTETDAPEPGFPDAGGHAGFLPPPRIPHDDSSHTHAPPGKLASSSGALIAGVATGGIILALILLIAVLLWCKNRRDK